jgi:hypothetical protein
MGDQDGDGFLMVGVAEGQLWGADRKGKVVVVGKKSAKV